VGVIPSAPCNVRRRRRWYGVACLALLAAAGWFGWPQALGWYHWRTAQQDLERHDFAAASAHFGACAHVWPHSIAVRLAAARAARKAGLLDQADEHLGACQRLEKKASEERTLEVTLLQIERGPMSQAQEKYLQDYLQHEHADAQDVLEALADQYLRRSRYVEAARLLDAWLERRPDQLEVLVRRGWVADHLFDFETTQRCYEKALAIAPDRDNVRLRLAELLLLNNRAAEARAHLEKLRPRSDAPGVTIIYARCLEQLGQTKEARVLLDQVLLQHPEDAQALSERGKVALDEQKPGEAEVYLTRALKRAPKDRQILYTMSQCLERQNKQEEAGKYARMLKEIDEDIKTVGQLVQDVMRRPHDAELRYRIGAIFLKNGQEEEAMHWFATALEENPVHRGTHQTMADYYERLGDRERAKKHRQIIEAILPKL
jgi:tetratricopeptide (TPR) repeat protein